MNLLLSLATSPFLLGIAALETLGETLIEVGRTSEEVFRGDRLPVLQVSPDQADDLTSHSQDNIIN